MRENDGSSGRFRLDCLFSLSVQKRYGKIMAVGKDCLAMKYKDQYGSERCIRKGISCRLGRRPDKGRKAEENVCNS